MDDVLPPGESRDLARLAFDLAPSGMLAVDSAGVIRLANREAERLFGYGAGELAGLPVDSLVPAASRMHHASLREGFFADAQARPMGANRQLRGLRRDGSEFPVEVGLNPVRLAAGIAVIASVVDITARREAERLQREHEERARQAQKLEALGTLAGGIAHDFNNVLLGIVGYTELAQRAADAVPGVHDDLDQVLRAAERGRQLVRRILAFARRQDAALTPIAADRVVREAVELLRASLPATIEMRFSIAPGLPRVLADETQLHQVILNLGTNGAHAMEQGGVLEVSLAAVEPDAAVRAAHPELQPGPHLRLRVADQGTGMTPEVRARVFEPFFTTKPAGRGSGLGLSVILGIVRSLDGAIELQTAPGAGTRVDVWLPAAAPEAGATPAAADAGAGGAGKRHVLFVEDEPALAVLERRQLEALGYRVTAHTSSSDALEDFRARPDAFDVLVTDNTMPRLTGLQLAKEITALRPGLPVLMVSGYAETADPDVLRDHGVRSVLRKPHTSKELGEALRALLGGA